MNKLERMLAWLESKAKPNTLPEFNVQPGPWFKKYLNDWMEAFDVDTRRAVTSGIVTGQVSGDYIWVTNTPEWDRDWFEENGFSFPSKWVRYECMNMVVGEDGGPALMPGL